VLLVIGYFVCGFHVAFVGGHLPAYISDKGIGLSLFGWTLLAGRARRLEHRPGRAVQHRGSILWSSMASQLPAQEPAVAALSAAALVFLGFVLRRCRPPRC
jgi:hypothetical protein